MQARISAVQQALFGLLIVAVLLGVVTRPAPQNQRYKAALDEIDSFRATFDRAQLEHSLIEYAAAQGRQPLASIQRAAAGKQVPPLQLAPNAGVLEPLVSVSLATLADVQNFAKEKSTLGIAVADAPSIGRALSWRLVSNAAAAPFTLESASIVPASVTQADLDREPEVARLQLERSAADTAVQEASKKLDSAEQTFETRRKWKLPWKALVKSDEARKEAKAALIEKQKALKDLEQRYAQASSRAQAPRAAAAGDARASEFGLAQLAIKTHDKPWSVAIPVKITQREVVVPSLRGGDFTAIHAAGLWPEVRGLDPAAASAAIRKHFNWHYSYVEPLGIKIGGMTLLQLLPCVLPFLLALVLMRMRAVSSSYNPFGTKVKGSLPRVGFMNRLFDALIVVGLPVVASVGAAVALMMVGQVPALPVINAIVCLLLGGYAFMKLGELQTLIEEVVRSHSNPPPDSDS